MSVKAELGNILIQLDGLDLQFRTATGQRAYVDLGESFDRQRLLRIRDAICDLARVFTEYDRMTRALTGWTANSAFEHQQKHNFMAAEIDAPSFADAGGQA